MIRAGMLSALLIACFWTTAVAQGTAARVEHLRAGPYTLEVAVYNARPSVSRPVRISVRVHEGGASSLSMRGVPGPETLAVATRPVVLRPDPLQPGAYAGAVLLSVRGLWELEVIVAGPLGTGGSRIPIAVTASNAVPEWVGWMMGMSPLAVMAWFAWWQRRYLRTLMTEEGQASWRV